MTASPGASNGPEPLAQNFTVVATVQADTPDAYWYFLNTGFTILKDGALLAAGAEVVKGKNVKAADGTGDGHVRIARSLDGGKTWADTARIPFRNRMEVMLHARGQTAYLFVSPHGRDGVMLVASSTDRGATWSDFVEVVRRLAGPARTKPTKHDAEWEIPTEASTEEDRWFCGNQMAMAEKNGQLYIAVSERCQSMAVMACDLARGVTNPDAWRISENVRVHIPPELNRGLFPGPSMRCLEGNVISLGDRLRVIARMCIDRYATANLAAIFDLHDKNDTLRLDFTQYSPTPGGQGKFFIVQDPVSRLYWMASNLPANTQGLVEPPPGSPRGNERRFLFLWYACDALNWFPAGCIARTERMSEAFMYPVMHIVGDDLVLVVRTVRRYEGLQAKHRAASGFHDANMMTFHRIKDFRSLAMDIWPRM